MNEKKLLIADDEENVRKILKNSFTTQGYEVLLASDGEEAVQLLSKEKCFAALLDLKMPKLSGLEVLETVRQKENPPQVIIMTAQDTMKNTVEAMKLGAFDYVSKPFDIEDLEKLVERAWKTHSLEKELSSLKEEKPETFVIGQTLIGQSRPMQEIYKMIGRVAVNDLTVLIQGESGTGKELIARAIHANSGRQKGPFVPVNVAAIPPELLESELFGYRKGAFTGAHADHTGYFEEADGGTLFLDEIGDMPLPLQAKVLRVVQDKIVQRVGSVEGRPVNLRFIAATHRNLEKQVQNGEFREDLFYRLNVVPLTVPPLRERKDDLPLLTRFFLEKFSTELGIASKKLSDKALKRLGLYSWPGNVRELENVIKRGLVFCSGNTITPEIIVPFLSNSLGPLDEELLNETSLEEMARDKISSFLKKWGAYEMDNLYETIIRRIEKPLLELIMQKSRGNQIKAAHMLGINRNTLRKKLKDLKIPPQMGRVTHPRVIHPGGLEK
ncbi:MAG: sigma-54 dependent transcriptional regulator [bacterium]|nr:sigma-54 dependent transcriptional regulator [bacterium]